MKLRAMRSGMTLIEVILAGSIAVLMTLALLEGIIVSTKISHENAQLLAAEGYAWETAWRWLSKASNDLNGSSTMMYYPDAAGVVIASNECPTICRDLTCASGSRRIWPETAARRAPSGLTSTSSGARRPTAVA